MGGHPSHLVASALACAALALAAPARAADPTPAGDASRLRLRWDAPEGCPGAPRIVAEVNRLLGASAPSGPPLVAAATVSADPAGGLRVRIEAEGAGGARIRELRAASCQALADATVTILVLMIDPDAVVEPPAAAPAPSPPTPAPPPAPPSAPPPKDPEPPPSPTPHRALTPRFGLAAWGTGDAGSLPGFGLGVSGAAAVSIAALRLELGVVGLPSRSASVAMHPGTGGDVSLVAGNFAACYDVLPRGPFELSPCLGYEVGRLHGAGFGVTTPGTGDELWSAAKGAGLFSWSPIPRLALLLRVDAAVPIAARTFVLQDVGNVYRPGPVAVRVGLGVEVRL